MVRSLLLLPLLVLATAAAAEDAPFDMSPEQAVLPRSAKIETIAVRPRQPEPEAPRRHILSLAEPRLVGEEARRSWSVYLTAAEAAGATLDLGFSSSILVAPEASRLSLAINGTPVVDTAIRAADAPARLSVPLPAGVLRPGPNVFALDVQQRHRTDCSVASTYDLWTDLDPAQTFLGFADTAALVPTALQDLLATAPDATGATRIAILVPERADGGFTVAAMRLAQVLSLAIGAAHPVVSIHTSAQDPGLADAGLRVILAPGHEARFEVRPGLGAVLVVGDGAVDRVAAAVMPSERPSNVMRTAAWHLPDAPVAFGAERLDFAALGVPSQEFTGRRASVGFQLALPSDFYAQGYGEMQLVLDGAYSAEVLPGSRIDVYVNDSLASTMPLGNRGGGILHRLPLGVTMRHLRPGVNTVRLEAILETASDASCAPGSTSDTPRFALFDTSSLDVPRFARLGRLPDLAATTERAFPYGRTRGPVRLVLGDNGDETLSAAATLLAKIAQSSGRIVPVDLASTAAPDADAILVGAVNRLPAEALAAVALDPAAPREWSGAGIGPVAPGAVLSAEPLTLDGWRSSIARGTWLQPIDTAAAFLRDNAPRLPWMARSEQPFRPGADTTLVLAQAQAPGGGTWTVLTAPTADLLATGTAKLVQERTWADVGGRLAALQAGSDVPFVVPATVTTLVATQPWSFANLRLIAANWMSINVAAFSALLLPACLLLGLATRAMLATFGRRR